MNKGYRPIYYHEFINTTQAGEEKRFVQERRCADRRHRYWARSFLGYPPVRQASANSTHMALAQLLKNGYVSRIITQVRLLPRRH